MKFRYGDVVEVVDGFYEGQVGIAIRCSPITTLLGALITYEYQIELEDTTLFIFEDSLTLLRREKEKDGTH